MDKKTRPADIVPVDKSAWFGEGSFTLIAPWLKTMMSRRMTNKELEQIVSDEVTHG